MMHCRPRDIIILFTLLLLAHAGLHAQQQQVRVKASVDRTTILIGEPIKLNLEAWVPSGTSFKWFSTDTIPHFEIIDAGKQDSARDANANFYRQQLTITSFDSGSWTIPAFVLQAGRRRFRTDTLSIAVTFSPQDTAQGYHDIKDILAVKDPGNPYIPWIIAAVTLLALLGIIYFLRKKKKPAAPVRQPVSKLTPVEEAMQALNELKKEDLPRKGEVKQFYTRLNDILRWYVFRKFNITSLEKTNEELVLQLKQTRLSHPDYTTLAQALRMADFVKFAKYTPSAEDQEQTFDVIKNSISKLEASATPST
jgi:hypothetical protein